MKDIKLDSIFKNKIDWYFIIIGITLSVLVIWVFVEAINFLAFSVDTSLEFHGSSDNNVRFNLNSLESLGIKVTTFNSTSSTSTSSTSTLP